MPHVRLRSLKLTLLAWLVPTLLVSMAAGLWISNRLLEEQAGAAYDRTLAGILRAIDVNLSTESGGLALEQPYRLLEFFQLTATGRLYYRVATEDGLAEIGFPALPMPDTPLPLNDPVYYDGVYYDGEPVRVAALLRELDPPLHRHGVSSRVIIQVAENLDARDKFTRHVLLRAAGRDLGVVLLAALLLVIGIIMALRPLQQLQRQILRRRPDDFSPISPTGMPAEVRPLIDAVNQHMQRYQAQWQVQRQFLDDASHQLRTPLSVLRTQVGYALREQEPAEMQAALAAMADGLDRAIRVTNQLLALARASHAERRLTIEDERFDMAALVEESVRLMLPAARRKQLDYGMDLPGHPLPVTGMRLLLQEAVLNVLDNAIRYTPHGGTLSVSALRTRHGVQVVVEDSGPGMSEHDIRHAGTRFRRGAAGRQQAGAGLGLAIVRTILTAHGGTLTLATKPEDSGMRVCLNLPAPGIYPEN